MQGVTDLGAGLSRCLEVTAALSDVVVASYVPYVKVESYPGIEHDCGSVVEALEYLFWQYPG